MAGCREHTLKAAVGAAGVALFAVVAGAVPARAMDPSDRMMIEKGREVFLTAGGVGCVTCHGAYAEGSVGIGPSIRGSSERSIRTALQTEKCMEFLRDEISEAHVKQLGAYYQWLGQLKLVKALVSHNRFVPDRVEVHPGTKVQLVVVNADAQAHSFTGTGLGFDKVTVEARDDISMLWDAPEREGTVSLACADCRGGGQRLTIAVTTQAPKFVAERVAPKTPATAAPVAGEKVALTASEREMVDKGRDLFLNAGAVGCAGCHGRYAEGDLGIGSYNRGFSEFSIRRALKTVGPMAFLADELGETGIKQIAAYYKSLAHTQLVKTVIVRGLFVPQDLKIRPGTAVQFVITNTGHAPRTFITGPMGLGRITVPAKEAVDLTWTAPNHPGDFALACVDCPYRGQQLSIEVTGEAPPYAPPVALR